MAIHNQFFKNQKMWKFLLLHAVNFNHSLLADMLSVKLLRGFERLILGLKFLCILAFIIIFLYWSITAVILFKSGPISSSVSYRFGDDGHGNYEFPAITICLDSFKWIGMSPNGMMNKCLYYNDRLLSDDYFLYHLMHCTYDKNQSSNVGGELLYIFYIFWIWSKLQK